MDKEFEKAYHALEETHWWFQARRDMIRRLVSKYGKDTRILEIGCSGGRLIEMLNGMGYHNTAGIDISNAAVKLCEERNIGNVMQMDGKELNFEDNGYDLIIASDVLEHIGDDYNAVREWKRVLKKGGDIICFVPAFKFLWSDHDVVNRHLRRYSSHELSRVFKSNGFEIIRESYWNFLLFFPLSIISFIKDSNAGSPDPDGQLYRHRSLTNRLLYSLLRAENVFLELLNFPVGVSLFLIARK